MVNYPDAFLKSLTKEIWFEKLYGDNPPQLFAIISWGSAATLWLSKVLNSHPEIFCLHAMNLHMTLDNTRRAFPKNDGLEYLHIIAKSADGYQAAGDIHGISRHDIPEIRRLLGDKFNAAVVVRDPIPRLKSALSHFRLLEEYQLYNIDYVSDIIKNKNLVLPHNDYGERLFVHGVNMLNAIIEEVNVGEIYRAEDLTTNESKLTEFIEKITNGKIRPDSKSLSNMLKIDRVNKHVKEEIRFADWQTNVIKLVISDKAWKLYSKLGYSKPDFL